MPTSAASSSYATMFVFLLRRSRRTFLGKRPRRKTDESSSKHATAPTLPSCSASVYNTTSGRRSGGPRGIMRKVSCSMTVRNH
eukprot:4020661-Pyramimonas_sp.AAC.1